MQDFNTSAINAVLLFSRIRNYLALTPSAECCHIQNKESEKLRLWICVLLLYERTSILMGREKVKFTH